MNFPIDPDDIEPFDADERLDWAYGLYHIGRDNELRDEVAMFFDLRLLPEPDFLTSRLWSIVNRHDGRLFGFSDCASSEYTDDQLIALLMNRVNGTRPFDGPLEDMSIVVAELPKSEVVSVQGALRIYTAYVGYADISWPSSLRSIVMAKLDYI